MAGTATPAVETEPSPEQVQIAVMRLKDFITSCQMAFPYISDMEDTEGLNRLARAGAGLEKMPEVLQIFEHLAAKTAKPANPESPEVTRILNTLAEIRSESQRISADQGARPDTDDRIWIKGQAERWIVQNADMVLNTFGRPTSTGSKR